MRRSLHSWFSLHSKLYSLVLWAYITNPERTDPREGYGDLLYDFSSTVRRFLIRSIAAPSIRRNTRSVFGDFANVVEDPVNFNSSIRATPPVPVEEESQWLRDMRRCTIQLNELSSSYTRINNKNERTWERLIFYFKCIISKQLHFEFARLRTLFCVPELSHCFERQPLTMLDAMVNNISLIRCQP